MVVNAFRFGKLSQKIKFSFSKKFSAAAVNSSLMSSFKKIGLRTVSNISEISPSSILLLGRSECARLGLLRILETVPTAGETNIFEGMEEDEDEVKKFRQSLNFARTLPSVKFEN
ncbi:hypothetical protein MHBO_001854 [Bonamia ostreae]|uniref:Uncharacterized protein n=1 Tax=Bonamia ostreae TaxID=126728 RepID=A0ABV2AKJ0_9EUKA